MFKNSVLTLAAVLILAAAAARADTLCAIKKRGFLACGSNPGRAGFGLPDGQGHWTGLDADFCRALAAAIFDDAGKVKFVPLTAKDRFTALQSGAVDVLASNTTWTLSRETAQGLLFAGVNYYDGQRFMVHKKLNRSSALELSGASICVQQFTTTELNLADFFHANNMTYKPVAFERMLAEVVMSLRPMPRGFTRDGWRSPIRKTILCSRTSSPRSRLGQLCAKAMIVGSIS